MGSALTKNQWCELRCLRYSGSVAGGGSIRPVTGSFYTFAVVRQNLGLVFVFTVYCKVFQVLALFGLRGGLRRQAKLALSILRIS